MTSLGPHMWWRRVYARARACLYRPAGNREVGARSPNHHDYVITTGRPTESIPSTQPWNLDYLILLSVLTTAHRRWFNRLCSGGESSKEFFRLCKQSECLRKEQILTVGILDVVDNYYCVKR